MADNFEHQELKLLIYIQELFLHIIFCKISGNIPVSNERLEIEESGTDILNLSFFKIIEEMLLSPELLLLLSKLISSLISFGVTGDKNNKLGLGAPRYLLKSMSNLGIASRSLVL